MIINLILVCAALFFGWRFLSWCYNKLIYMMSPTWAGVCIFVGVIMLDALIRSPIVFIIAVIALGYHVATCGPGKHEDDTTAHA